MSRKKIAPVSTPRRLLAAQVLGVYIAVTVAPPAYAVPTDPPPSLAQVPQFLPSPLAPNLLITLDDSGSMQWAYMPDSMCWEYATRRVKSAAYNPLYYDPRVRYELPLRFDANNNRYERLTTSFTHAYVNGFAPQLGATDLSQAYRVTWSYDPATSGASTTYDAGCQAVGNRYAENPAADFLSSAGDLRRAGVPAYYYIFDPAATGCVPAATSNDNCYRLVTVSATSGPAVVDLNGDGTVDAADRDERQNFAIWYSFYRTRNLATVSAASLALAGLPDSVRVAWQALTTCAGFTGNCSGWAGGVIDNRIRPFTPTHRANLYSWLLRLPAQNNTPLRRALARAGEYYRTAGVNSPYAEHPQVERGTEFACRPNFHLLMTDGLWNEGDDSFCSGAMCGNVDGSGRILPDQTLLPSNSNTTHPAYQATHIYRDSNSNSLADVAFHYWATDLRPDLPNNLTPYYAERTGDPVADYWNPKNDPATWQHMVNFTVGLGLTAVMTAPGIPWGGATHQGTGYQNLRSGAATWPATGPDSVGNVYDLWHAAINSRGLAFSADRPDQLLQGFQRIVREVARTRSVVGTAAAASTAYLEAGNAVYTAEFRQGSWSGNLYRREIDPQTLTFRTTDSNGNPLPRDANGQPYVWRASDALPTPAQRRIFTMRYGPAAREAVVPFEEVYLTAAQRADLTSPLGSAADVIQYVRGDRSREQSASPPGVFRDRPRAHPNDPTSHDNVLGTIANAAPIYVKALDWGYDFLPPSTGTVQTGRETYLRFLRANQGNSQHIGRPATLWVGSNGGMFQAFDARTGVEKFAYVPRAVIRNLPLLVDPDYTHRYLVDGVPAQGDAYFGTGCGPDPNDPSRVDPCWRTVVVSSLGAGGRSVFAIDATDPNNLDANSVLWELDDQSLSATDFARLGYVLGPAIIARVKDAAAAGGARWVAVFANGPESANHTAALFVVDLASGAIVRILDTGVGNASDPNGLSAPAPLFDAQRNLIAVYAGDLRGNLWKFDLSSPDVGKWTVAFGGQPLFTTRSPADVGPLDSRNQPQPIFAAPLLQLHPDGGVMVIFGTGKLLSPGDRERQDVQTLYGVWDKPNEVNGIGGNFRGSGGLLVQQKITSKSGSPALYTLTANSVNYLGGQRGWYIDLGVVYSAGGTTLATPRERIIVSPRMFGGSLVALSFVPSVDACDVAGTSFLYRLNYLSGSFVSGGSFGAANSAAVAMGGTLGLLAFVERPAQGSDASQRSGVLFGVGLAGEPEAKRLGLVGFGAFRTWRQLIE
ncbi:MAG: PilC/PilY family type IV pilus protein [Sutterellaceae bacterium]|nr:PilC/PilY family type IV pilus protein [Burkholderiaceae bacterium]MDW8429726.1 PilC/PilY family type IV pilus protein [Sutterellaceae bacterium]